MNQRNIFFIHGFLGLPQDWDQVLSHLNLPTSANIQKLNLWSYLQTQKSVSFESWAEDFNQNVIERYGNVKDSENILVGYSLGGRLAGMALRQNPELWHKLILLSSNLSFDDDWDPKRDLTNERQARSQADALWAKRFREENWDKVVGDWNAQSVFVGSQKEPLRTVDAFDRETIGRSLEVWSQARHQNMRRTYKDASDKILSLVGALDSKYLQQWSEFKKENEALNLKIIANSGHRLLFDQPEEVAKEISLFLK
ncbi:MAG: alpha/beta fold hydrolase [Bdellovibrionia bacterium]